MNTAHNENDREAMLLDGADQQQPTLRMRAETITRQHDTGMSLADIATMTPENIQRMFHDLHVHQIELEMQNEELQRAQREIDQARQRYFDLYDLAPVGYCTVDRQGKILEANLTLASLLGRSRSQMIGQLFFLFVHPENRYVFHHHFKRLFDEENVQRLDIQMMKYPQRTFWAHMTASPSLDTDRATECRLVVADITERKQREEAKNLMARLVILLTLPGDFRKQMAEVVESLKAWSGFEAVGIRLREGEDYSLTETRGFSSAFVQSEKYLSAHCSDGSIAYDSSGKPLLECMCGNILSGRFDPALPCFTVYGSFWTNAASSLETDFVSTTIPPRTRNKCIREGYESIALIPLKVGSKILGMIQFNDTRPGQFIAAQIVIYEEIAESLASALLRHEIEEELRSSKSRLDAALSSANDAIFISDAKGRLIEFNEAFARFCKFENKQACFGTLAEYPRLFDVFWADGTPVPFERWAIPRALQGEVGNNVEYLIRRKDTDEIWVGSYSFAPIRDQIGEIVGAVVTTRDITDRKQAEAEKNKLEARLLQTQKMEAIGTLAGGIAHDLNNILFPISGLSELLLEEFLPESLEYEMIQQIHRSVLRGSELVKQILMFSRQSTVEKKPVRLQSVLKEALKLVRASLSHHIEIKSYISSHCGIVLADLSQIHQILMNLVTNAAHAVEEKSGTIHVALTETVIEKEAAEIGGLPTGRYACIRVSDTGIGIENRVMDKIFTPYFTTKDQGKGTGLGLSVVLGIVRDHGGDIRVVSEIGKGTTVSVYLPLVENESGVQTATPNPSYPTGTEHILLVDDEPAILNMEKMTLEKLGYRITACASALKALSVFSADPGSFDLVLCDRGMPKMNGETLAKEMRAIRPEIPIILCTGFSNEGDESLARAMGINGYLMKPVAKAELAETIRNVLDTNS